jgi:hypothetical protein
MRLRRRAAALENLGRRRVGFSEGEVQLGLYPSYPRRGLVSVLALGGAGFNKGRRGATNAPAVTPKED